MANKTENRRQGCGNITIDTEVTENGIYPVEGKGIYSAINAAKPGNATAAEAGLVKKASAVADVDTGEDATAAANATAINAILAALRTAGVMETPTP